jgi:hypothetical protein
MFLRILIILGLLSLTWVCQAAVFVPPEVFQPPITKAATPKALLRLAISPATQRNAKAQSLGNSPNAYRLPSLSTDEQQRLQQNEASPYKAYRIGLGRALPTALNQVLDLSQWTWTALVGGQAAHFTLSSTGATRLRAQLQLGKWPQSVELRVFSPSDSSLVQAIKATANSTIWTETIAGDSLGLELFVPDAVAMSDIELSILQLSHLVLDPSGASLKASSTTDPSLSCLVDIKCDTAEWQDTGQAVARYVFTEQDGNSFLCSGTLVADRDTNTQIPYFLTAAHCVNNDYAASNMEFYWMYQNTSCGGADASYSQTTGGASLHATDSSLDTTLVELKTFPPVGITLAGWTTTSLSSAQAVTGIHHPQGYPKKISQGQFVGRVKVTPTTNGGYMFTSDTNGAFSKVQWSSGVTAPGSSGSGIWVKQNGIAYLNGTLLGGSSSCTYPTSPDEYSRLELFYPAIKAWLDTPAIEPSFSVLNPEATANALVDGVMIERYLAGKRGTALTTGVLSDTLDTVALEKRLTAAQTILDIDADGSTDSLHDTVLLNRYLLGLRGNSLINNLNLVKSGRNTAASIETYLQSKLSKAP